MTTITIYRNKRNENKYIEVHNDGYYHNSVVQYMEWEKDHKGKPLDEPIRNKMGDREVVVFMFALESMGVV